MELDVGPSRQLGITDTDKRDVLRGRPREVEHRAAKRGDLLRLTAGSRDHPDGGKLLEARALTQVGEERDLLAVRRPGGAGDVVCRSGEPLRFATIDVRDPRAGELVSDSNSVEAPGVVADAPGDRVVFFADDETFLARTREDKQPFSVGRPIG